jgi:hypothetical protein
LIEVVANTTNLDDTLFVIDTACKGGNVVKDPALLDQLTRSTAKVTGVSGHQTKISHMGKLPLAGRSVMMEGAVENLIAINNLTDIGLNFAGDAGAMKFYSPDGEEVFTAGTVCVLLGSQDARAIPRNFDFSTRGESRGHGACGFHIPCCHKRGR